MKQIKKEELETLSYTDLTELILSERKRGMNTAALFKEICKQLKLSDDEYASYIGDYYTSLTTDKRFILLDNGNWDLKDKHAVNIVLEDDDEEETIEGEEEEDADEIEETVEPEDIDSMDDEEGIDDEDDELEDLTILNEEEMEE